MSNPRKFSEKIALHCQKQADETAAFQQIMNEVHNINRTTTGGGGGNSTTTGSSSQGPGLGQGQGQTQSQGGGGGGSTGLPNASPSVPVPTPNNTSSNHLSISLSGYPRHGGSLPNVNQMAQLQQQHGERGSQSPRGYYQPSMSPRSQRNSIGPVRTIRSGHKSAADVAPYASPPGGTMYSSSVCSGSGGFYGTGLPGLVSGVHGTNYLLPPMDGNAWRRANSDSALNSLLIPSTVPDSSEESSNNSNDPRDNNYMNSLSFNSGPFQNSSGGGNGNQAQAQGLLEIPPNSTSANSGSLPDLTNFHFPPSPGQPQSNPNDNQTSNSPYANSPLAGQYSPSISPHSSPQGAGTGNMGQPQLDNQVHINASVPSPNTPNSFQNFSQVDNMLSAYRNPQRPSPQNSPIHFRSPSPLDGQLSGPGSPSAPGAQNSQANNNTATNQVTTNDFFINQQAHALHQHFEQFSVTDPLNLRKGNQSNHALHLQMSNSRQQAQSQGQQLQFLKDEAGNGSFLPGVYYTQNQGGTQMPPIGATAGIPTNQHHQQQHHQHQQQQQQNQQSPQNPGQPQTPQTPSSIPDIIFTEFLGSDFSDIRSSSDQLPIDDFLASEQLQAALRDGLGPLDLESFQMLDQHNLVELDPHVEDSFRLDRL